MSFLLSRRNGTNSLIGTRIQLLTSQQKVHSDKDCSPTLKELREKEKNRIQKFSDIFERKAWILKGNGPNWWLNERPLSPKSARSSTPKKSKVFVFPPPPSAPAKSTIAKPKVDDAIKLKKLLKIEEKHISDVRDLIHSLDELDWHAVGHNQSQIKENKYFVFGDLKIILDLHATIVTKMSRIIKSNGKCIELIKTIADLIDNGNFYCYVEHKMMEKTLKKFRVDPLVLIPNVNPLKMVEIYHEWTSNLCNELIKRPLENADDIEICMEAEKKLTNLMDFIADAEDVTRITQVSEVPLDTQFKVYSILKRNEVIVTTPMLLLIPNKHFKYGYRYPVSFIKSKCGAILLIIFPFTARSLADGKIR